jgi:hypothetical protein
MGEPKRLYIRSEIILDEGLLPAGVTLDAITNKMDEQIWGTLVPVLGIKATKERGKSSRVHVHNSSYDRNCDHCMSNAQDEENSDNA